MPFIDLRSDTVTQPTEEMRHAMAQAPVGDDVYGDDPTVNELEAFAAALLGKEAALFVPSGTFGNQVSILAHTRRGDEILVGDMCHILIHEVGAAAVLAGVQTRSVRSTLGEMDLSVLEASIREDDIHLPRTGLICIENAHSEGTVLSLEHMQAVHAIGQRHGIPVHIDGARLFNAAAALGIEAKALAACGESANICLSKGLCAPVGSLVIGSRAFINSARKYRKLMGGGMRQAGILAAAGLIALKDMHGRLHEDHARAERLAQALAMLPGIEIRRDMRDINMVFFTRSMEKMDDATFVAKLREAGILINGIDSGLYRLVTHHGVDDADIQKTIEVLTGLL